MGHPWVYSNEIEMNAAAKALPPGTIVRVMTSHNEDLGTATFNPHNLIAARFLSQEGDAVIDAGFLALSKDRSTANTPHDVGYGRVADIAGTLGLGDVTVVGVHQEHGMVEGRTPLPFDRLPVGARVRVLPNHACITSAAYDRYHVIDGSDEIVAVWPRCNGW